MILHDDQCTDQRQPHEHEARCFFGKNDPGIETVTQDHIAKHQNRHDAEHHDQNGFDPFDQLVEEVHA